jgi:hypothetical protein
MELNLEVLKDEKIVKKLVTDFSMKEEYYKFHDYIKKSGVKFEIQEYHDVFIFPMKHSENEFFKELINEYVEINPKIKDFYEANCSDVFDKLCFMNATTVSSNLFSHQKAAALNLISKSIENSIIQLGENENKLPPITKLLENLKFQASKYQTPIDKLTPKYESFFYEEMLRELVNEKLITNDFKDPKIRFEWVNFAFYFGSETHNINSSILTLNWISSASKLADFLMFLFSNLIEYKFEDKSEFYDWIILHFEIKGESLKRGKTNLETLKRNVKRIKDKTSINFRINDSKMFEIGYFITPVKTQEIL